MSQDNNNTNNNTNEENKFVNSDQSGWASGNFPTIDLNFDIDEDELNEALKKDQQKRRGKHSKHGKKEHQHEHEHGPNCDHDHDHDHDHEHDHDGEDDCDDCCGPKYKKEDITAEMLKKAEETYEEGLGAYKEGDYSTAADTFSEAVSVLAPYYGDDDLKMVDIYYHYGDAILNLARQKILSSIIIDMDEGDFDEEGNNIVPNIHFNHKKNLKDDLLKIEEVDDDENVIEVLQGDGDGDDDDEDDDYLAELEEEVADDLEVAWDILETARAILNHKSGDNPDLEKLSNIHLSLGSIGVETENIDLAIQEYNECITLRKKLFGDRHRKTAEAYYMLAMAYCSSPENAKFDVAIEKLTETQGILEENLKAAEEQKNEMDVIELSELLEEVKLRIEDLKDPNFKFGNFLDIEGEDDDDN